MKLRFMKKGIILLSIFLFVSLLFGATELQEVEGFAQKNFKDFVATASSPQNRTDFRLGPQDNEFNAQLGHPVKLMELSSEKILSCNNYSEVRNFLLPCNSYIFPVKFNGETKLILTVSKIQGENSFEISEIGNASMAHELSFIEKMWPVVGQGRYILCTNFQTSAFAFSIPGKSKDNLTIINAIDTADRTAYSKLSSCKETIGFLKNILKSGQ
jgi:hypothetical protein